MNNATAVKEKVRRRKLEIALWFANYKSKLKCTKCDENASECLDFHHKESNKKDFTIANAVRDGWGIEKLVQEIEKCVVLCANCHRKLHTKIK